KLCQEATPCSCELQADSTISENTKAPSFRGLLLTCEGFVLGYSNRTCERANGREPGTLSQSARTRARLLEALALLFPQTALGLLRQTPAAVRGLLERFGT